LLFLNPKELIWKTCFAHKHCNNGGHQFLHRTNFPSYWWYQVLFYTFLGIKKCKSCREPSSQFCKIANANDCHGICVQMHELFWVLNCHGIDVQRYKLFWDLKIAIPPP
jgi:hypothetical protein